MTLGHMPRQQLQPLDLLPKIFGLLVALVILNDVLSEMPHADNVLGNHEHDV